MQKTLIMVLVFFALFAAAGLIVLTGGQQHVAATGQRTSEAGTDVTRLRQRPSRGLAVDVEGDDTQEWTEDSIEAIARKSEAHDLRELAQALLGSTSFRVEITGTTDDNEGTTTRMIDLNGLGDRDQLLLVPSGRGTYGISYTHVYLTDDNTIEKRELFGLDDVTRLRFRRL